MSGPTVSVCIPTYNSARYLPQTVESVLRQEWQDYEVIICDDASTDDTRDVCGCIGDPRVRYVRFDQRGGAGRSWNRCLAEARGAYVVLLHADDLLDTRFLGRGVKVLEDHADVGLVHCSVQHIDDEGRPLHIQRLYTEDRIGPGDEMVRRLLIEGCVVNPAGVMVRRQAYERAGRFAEQIVWGIDWHMWLRIALEWPVAYLTEPLAMYRQHPASDTSGVMSTARNGSDEMWLMNDIFERIGTSRPELATLRSQAMRQVAHRTWCFAEEMCRRGLARSARIGLLKSISVWPAMVVEGRVWALWLGTYVGYAWFVRLQRLKRWITKRAVR